MILGPRGGYLLSYPAAAALAGLAAGAAANAPRRRALAASFLWGCAALAAIYASGAAWLWAEADLPLAAAVAQGVLPFVAFDLVKVALAALVTVAVGPAVGLARAAGDRRI